MLNTYMLATFRFHYSSFCHQLSFVPLARSTSLIFVLPLATLTFTVCLTAFTSVLLDGVATSLLTALPFTTFVTTVAIPEDGLFGAAWSGDTVGLFFAPVHARRGLE
jgi:hypothetical protein